MKKKILAITLLTTMLVLGCSSMRVMVDYDDQFDFSNYKSFKFVTPKIVSKNKSDHSAGIKDPLFIKKASREISAILTSKGFQKTGKKNPADFLVAFYATAKNRAQITPPTYHIGRFGRRYVRSGHVYHYKQGTLIIDIVDRKSKELVWRGVGSGALNKSDPKKNLLEAVEKVLEKFPPME